jgi:hypothetical protein
MIVVWQMLADEDTTAIVVPVAVLRARAARARTLRIRIELMDRSPPLRPRMAFTVATRRETMRSGRIDRH